MDLVIEYKRFKNFVHNNSLDIAITLQYFALILISGVYIIIWVNLNSSIQWDIAARLGYFDKGILIDMVRTYPELDTHFLINWIPFIFSHIGIDALKAYRILAAISMLALVLGVFKFTYVETKDNVLAFLLAMLILLNTGFTTGLTGLNDKLPMYALYMFFILYLLKGCWVRSAIFLSLGILFASSESLAYIPMMMFFALLKLDFEKIFKDSQRLSTQIKEIITPQILLKVIIVTIIFIIPTAIIMFSRNISFNNYISNYFLASWYYLNPDYWYFTSNRTMLEQLQQVEFGIRNTFGYMQSYPNTFWLLLGLILYVSIISISPNRKTLCAIPTFLFLTVHTLFFDSYDFERWLFLPLFMIYFIAIGYAEKNESRKKSIRNIVLLIILISALFILGSYSSTGGHASPFYTFVTKIPELLDNKSIVIEAEADPSNRNDYLERYFCGNRAIFTSNLSDTELWGLYRNNTIHASDSAIIAISRNYTIYASRFTYDSLKRKFPRIVIEGDTIYMNEFDKEYDIVKLKFVEDSNNATK